MQAKFSTCSYNGSRVGVAVRRLAAALILAPALAGCGSIQIPLGNMMGGSSERRPASESTGSIAPMPAPRVASQPLAPLSPTPAAAPMALAATPAERREPSPLSEAELQSVTATLAHALLDQERGASVPWLDQRSGHGGMVTPVGSPARQAQAVCRAVLVSVQRGSETSLVQGNACRTLDSWSLSDVRPFRHPA